MLTAREPSVKPLATATTAASGGAEKFPMEDEALRNAKASPFGRGVCEADGEGKPGTKEPLHSGKLCLRPTSQSRIRSTRPGCGTQHSLRSACVLLAAAPTATPCFRRWRRSSLLPLVGEPLAKPFTLRRLPRPPLGRGGGTASAVTERFIPSSATPSHP